MSNKCYNPERRAWRGRSYRKGGIRVKFLRENCESIEDSMVSLNHGLEGKEADSQEEV